MKKLPGDDLHGAKLTQGSVIVLSFTFIAMCVCIGFALYMQTKMHDPLPALYVIGPVIFGVGVLLCLPNLKNVIRGKLKERRIARGEEAPEIKKSYHPEHPWDD